MSRCQACNLIKKAHQVKTSNLRLDVQIFLSVKVVTFGVIKCPERTEDPRLRHAELTAYFKFIEKFKFYNEFKESFAKYIYGTTEVGFSNNDYERYFSKQLVYYLSI